MSKFQANELKVNKEIKVLQKSYNKNPRPEKLVSMAELFFSIYKVEDARICVQAAIAANPQDGYQYKLLGDCEFALGRHDLAMDLYRRSVMMSPGDDRPLAAAGNLCMTQKKYDEAADYFLKALEIRDSGENNNNVGVLLFEKGMYKSSSDYFIKAVSLVRDNTNYKKNLARALYRQGLYTETVFALHEAYKDNPEDVHFVSEICSVMRHIVVRSYSSAMKEILLLCLNTENLDHKNLSIVWISLLVLDPANSALFSHTNHGSYEEFRSAFNLDDCIGALSDPFVTQGLRLLSVQALEVERLFTRIRRMVLESVVDAGLQVCCAQEQNGEKLASFMLALAECCFMAEYAFLETPEESQMIGQLLERIAQGDDFGGGWRAAVSMALIGSYRSLWQEPPAVLQAVRSFDGGGLKAWKSFIALCIDEPMRERQLRATIPAIGHISDEVSEKVREQYEESPYPRWRYTSTYVDPQKPAPFKKKYKVLIAGCGTGKQVFQELTMYPNADITAVDLSLSSICYAKRKVEEAGVGNVKFYHADILDLGVLDEKFDFIMCSGVLHHMKEPERGLDVLLGLLAPEGIMNIGLYSEMARQRVVHFRDVVQRRGWNADLEGIRRFREYVMGLPFDDPNKLIARSRDFYSTSMCRDLIFHVQEHRFTLLQIEDLFKRHGLEFLCFSFIPPSTINDFKAQYPDAEDYTNLGKWHEYEQKNPEAFSAMYQMWVCRSEDAVSIRSAPKRINAL